MSERFDQLVKELNIPGEVVAVDESLVYRVEGDLELEAWKVYLDFPVKAIARYQEITRRVAETIDGTKGLIASLDRVLQFPFNWEVNPINEVIERDKVVITKSRFIEKGETLQDLLNDVSAMETGLHPLQEIEIKEGSGWVRGEIQEFCGKLNSQFLSQRPACPPIWFSTINIKVLESKLIVTDISPAVKIFKQTSN